MEAIDKGLYDFWINSTHTIVLRIRADTHIIEYNQAFEIYKHHSKLFDCITHTHQTKFLEILSRSIQSNQAQKELLHFSINPNDVTDIPLSHLLFCYPLDRNTVLVIAEPLPTLNHSEAKAYLKIINDYSQQSRELQKAEHFLQQANKQLNQKIAEIEYIASHDMLTTLYNRKKIFQLLSEKMEYSKNNNLPLSIIMLDIDHFKHINDTHGHQAGDEVLRWLSKMLRDKLAHYGGLIGRYGGEEFLILLPNIDHQKAYQIANRMRVCVKRQKINTDLACNIQVSISLGVTQFKHYDNDGSLIYRADTALYKAKNSGRDRAIIEN